MYLILTVTPRRTGYIDVGNGVCRIGGDDTKGYGHWGAGTPTDHGDAVKMCNADPKCMGFWKHTIGSYQFFCSEETDLCNKGSQGSITKPSDLKGSGNQGGGSCFIKGLRDLRCFVNQL